MSEQSNDPEDTDTVSTFPPVYSRRATRCCFCGAIENYSVTLFGGLKNSIFLESQAVEATLATLVEHHRSDSCLACLFAHFSLTASEQEFFYYEASVVSHKGLNEIKIVSGLTVNDLLFKRRKMSP